MDLQKLVDNQREFFNSGVTRSLKFRLNALKRLKTNILSMQQEIFDGLKADLGKSASESYMSEVGMVIAEINHTIKHLKFWAKPKKVHTPISNFKAKSYNIAEPYGVVLVISPWNYPFLLSIDPLVGAIAAGNCVILKPSRESANVTEVIQKLIEKTFDNNHATVVAGENINDIIMLPKYDYVFFTGGKRVGKIIATKAMESLTPVSLELGGKSPCIVTQDSNLKLAATRIAFGKFLNVGQTCIAPDYLLVQQNVKEKFIDFLKIEISKMFSADAINNPDYGKIINQKQFDSLISMLGGGKIIYGGKYSLDSLKIEPTILDNVTLQDKVMQEEIFGPILPIMTYKNLSDAINIIKTFDKPLALYMFSNNKGDINKVISNLSFGGGCINDTIMHIANPNLAFGGVGASGTGKYHGKFSFLTFSNTKSLVKKSNIIDLPMRYQPYTKAKDKLVRFFMK